MAEINIYHKRGIKTFSTLEELLNLEEVSWHSNRSGFYGFAVGVSTVESHEYKITLIAMCDWNDDYNGCEKWWVVGFIKGMKKWELNLPQWTDLIQGHKPTCWHRKYIGNKDLLGLDRPEASTKKILTEMGWHRDDTFGIASYCDCGFTEEPNN